MKNTKEKTNFKSLLTKYLDIKGLDIVVFLNDGNEVELQKNRKLVKNEIVYSDKNNNEIRIKISQIRSIDLYAA